MFRLLFVGTGGFLGSVLRYALSGWVMRLVGRPWFPLGTLTVNVAGCFLIGLLGGMAENRSLFSPEARLFLFIGFLGGFTTFSTFGYEVFTFAHDGQLLSSALNLFLHLLLGVGAVWAGYAISKLI